MPLITTNYAVEGFFILGGFFLFSNLQQRPITLSAFAGRLYKRLVPAFCLAAIILVILNILKPQIIISALLLTTGFSLPMEYIKAGSWFIGVYFWIMILYFLILQIKSKLRWLLILLLVLSSFAVQLLSSPFGGFQRGFYFHWLVAGVVRGVSSIGLGILTASISRYIHIPADAGKALRYLLSALEITIFYLCIAFLLRGNYLNIWQWQLLFGALIVLCMQNAGYLSSFLNRSQYICYFSRYVYGIFVGQMLIANCLRRWRTFEIVNLIWMLIGSTVFGILEYHLVEKRLVPWILKNLKFNKNSTYTRD